MARKPRIFEKVKFGPFETEIRLDSSNGIFSCEYGGRETRSPVLEQVRTWAGEALKEACNLDWKPILYVVLNSEDVRVNHLKNCTQLEIRVERFYVAWAGTRWVRCPWVVLDAGHAVFNGGSWSEHEQEEYPLSPENLMKRRSASSEPFHDFSASPDVTFPVRTDKRMRDYGFYVPYTPETWATVLGIIDRSRELRASLLDMFGTAPGWDRLAAISQTNLLPGAVKSGELPGSGG